MGYTPPFTITTDILNLVADISQQVGMLDASTLNASPQLRKQNRIKTITGTLAIEGNSLTEEQITAIVDGKPVLGSVRELAEVKGAITAYDALPNFSPSNTADLLTAHGLMLGDILQNAGRFRSTAVGIHKAGVVHHVAPPAHRVSGLMAELTQWLANTKDHPLIASSVFHYEFEFMLSVIAETLVQNATINASIKVTINTETDIAGLNTPDAVLALLAKNPELTRPQLASMIGKDIRTIARALATLQQAGKVKRIGSNKTGYWKVYL